MKQGRWHKIPEHGLQLEETADAGDEEGIRALARYWWAWTVLKGADTAGRDLLVWDLGCGCGYGARILAEEKEAQRRNVLGVDVDHSACLSCWRDYPKANLQFIEFNLETPWDHPLLEQTPDVVVAFDFFEDSLKHRELFLEQLVSRAAPNSAFLLNAQHLYHPRPDGYPQAAAVRYDAPTLHRFLSRYYQQVLLASALPDHPAFSYLAHARQLVANRGVNLIQLGYELVLCLNPKKE